MLKNWVIDAQFFFTVIKDFSPHRKYGKMTFISYNKYKAFLQNGVFKYAHVVILVK